MRFIEMLERRGQLRHHLRRISQVHAADVVAFERVDEALGRAVALRAAHGRVVAVGRSDLRWCSGGFEIKCDSGETVTSTFGTDCCDREVMAWRSWEGKGLPGEAVREMRIEAVEQRFGAVEAIPPANWLGDPWDSEGGQPPCRMALYQAILRPQRSAPGGLERSTMRLSCRR